MKPQSSITEPSTQQQEEIQRIRKEPQDILGQILWGANNIFLVACQDGGKRKCRLRGKTLSHEGLENEHNPLICGDFVLLEASSLSEDEGRIYRRLQRRNALLRRNLKRGEPQAFAANLDGVILMVSWAAPPLRPAFLDRLLIAAQQSGSPILLLLNKLDYIHSICELWQLQHFLRQYRQLGLEVWPISLQNLQMQGLNSSSKSIPIDTQTVSTSTSTVEPSSMDSSNPECKKADGKKIFDSSSFTLRLLQAWTKLKTILIQACLRYFIIARSQSRLQQLHEHLGNRLYAVLGASGVGKSSLCNYLFPQQSQETRAISEKWQTGVHTTTLARTLFEQRGEFCYRLVDTPGMRNFLPAISETELPQLQNYYPEFASLRNICAYSPCLHRYEPDCAVRDAADYGLISSQRYFSYLNLYQDLETSLNQMPSYQTQGKTQKLSSNKAQGKNLSGLSKNSSCKSKGKGQRGDTSQSRFKERKKSRSKLQLHSDEQGNYDCENF